jgi:RND family efflux transporter MFP subunit
MRWRNVAVIGLVVVGVGAAGVAVAGPSLGSAEAPEFLTAPATQADVVDAVSADGYVTGTTTYGLTFGSDPSLVSGAAVAASAGTPGSGVASTSWLVTDVAASVGQTVKAGDVLATADAEDAQLALDAAKAQLVAAEARYAADKDGASRGEKRSAKDQVSAARQALGSAQRSRSQTASQNSTKVAVARRNVTRAQDQLDRDRAAGAPASVIDQDRAALRQARDNLELARAQASASNQQAADQVGSASVQLQAARNTYDTRTSKAGREVLAADLASIAQARQQVAAAQAQVDGAVLRAPVAGRVTAVDIVEGTLAPAGDAIRVMAGMEVAADFAESDLPSLKVGQPATVSIPATGDELPGTVLQIDPVAATGGDGSVVSYTVTVGLDDLPEGVLPGMTASVSVTTDEADGVVAIPSIALAGDARAYTVRTVDASGAVSVRPVTVGLVTDGLAEITSGIAAGERVVIGTLAQRASGASAGILPPDPGQFQGGGQAAPDGGAGLPGGAQP